MAKRTPLVSIIIPVHNTAEYLPDCLNSIMEQELSEIEIIVIDDGSTDDSWDVIRNYSAQDSRIKALRQSRCRQGAARNLGLDLASGDYIAFADSDDIVPKTAYRHLLSVARKYDSDMVMGVYKSFFRNRSWFELPLHRQLLKTGERCTDIYAEPALLEDISVCNKLVRRSLIDSYRLRFPRSYAGEDVQFTSELFLVCRSIAICPEIVYLCRRKRNAASSARINRKFFSLRQQTALSLVNLFEQHGAGDLYPWLVRSEIRKLAGSRLARVVNELPPYEQDEVFELLREMTLMLKRDEVYWPPEYFNAIHKICIRLLQEDEKCALRLFQQSRAKVFFLTKIRDPLLRREIAGLIIPLYLLGFRRLMAKAG